MPEIIPDNRKLTNFLHWGIWQPPFKMQILEIRFFHVRKGPNIGITSNFQGPMTSNGRDYPGHPQIGPFLTLGYMAAPLQNANFGNLFFFMLERVQI